MVFPGTYSETISRLAFAKIGVNDLKFIKLPPAEMAQALQTGRADAGIVYEPVATLAEVNGWGHVIERGFWERYLLPEIVVGAYAYNKPEGQQKPGLVLSSYRAIEKAVAAAKINPAQAKQSLMKHFKITSDIASRLPNARVEMAGEIDPRLVTETLDLYVKNGLIPREIDLSPLLRQP